MRNQTVPCPECGWRLPDGWHAEPQPIADQWMIYPPDGYGEQFAVSLLDPDIQSREDLHRAVRERVEARIREVEGEPNA